MASHKVFLAHNFDQASSFILSDAVGTASRVDVEICSAPPGATPASPATAVRNAIESSEALLAIVGSQSSWISSEIGIALAFDLPIYVIADYRAAVDGLVPYVTSISRAVITDPAQLNTAMERALKALVAELQLRRLAGPEPLPATGAVHRVSWRHYYELIRIAHRRLLLDIDGQGGYKPTVLLGISRGRIIVADILAMLAGDSALALLEADRKHRSGNVSDDSSTLVDILQKKVAQNRAAHDVRMLLVDDVLKSGKTLMAATECVTRAVNSLKKQPLFKRADVTVRSLALLRRVDSPVKADYVMEEYEAGNTILLPYGLG